MTDFLVRCEELDAFRQANTTVLLDVRSHLTDPQFGKAQYDVGHIPGALFLSLGDVVAGPRTGTNGRTPLADLDAFSAYMAGIGVNDDTSVVIYDNGDSNFACRAWFTFRCVGHEKVYVLDGGIRRWQALGLPVDTDVPNVTAGVFTRRPSLERVFSVKEVEAMLATQSVRLLDARSHARYLGKNETLDPVGGHIPSALSRPSSANINAEGVFYSADELRQQYAPLYDDLNGRAFVNYCGSGITACCNHMAQRLAGLDPAGVFIGSWSEWCADPTRPISTQDEMP